jgi:hypothetical protein
LSRISIGDDSPLIAIQEEVASRPGFYTEIIISTLPVDFSKWLSMGIPEKVEATFSLPVTHIYGGVTTVE